MVIRNTDTEKVSHLFDGWEETLIWSCLQNVMGDIYTRDVEHPMSALAVLGDFSFLAGEPDEELVLYRPEDKPWSFMIMVPQDERWAKLIETCYQERAQQCVRYAIKKEPGVFDREHLQRAVESLKPEYTLVSIDEGIYDWCKTQDWCCDWVSQYKDYETYKRMGLGVAVLKDGIPVAGTSSYSSYQGGIEIEIDTKMEYRRQGLAYACGAKLILECLDRGWYPSWDAQNLWSVGLAEKLGYHFDCEYVVYEVRG